MKKIVLASSNKGKLTELAALLAPQGFELLLQTQFTPDVAEEPHVTFVENALAKARFASAKSGLPALADDSGICVPVLGNAPGVQSARYAQQSPDDLKSDVANNQKLVANLRNISDRRAFFVCVLVFVRHEQDPMPIVAEGLWHGQIIDHPRGENGFGYDPHFELPDIGKTSAEISSALKNQLSHRAQALQQLLSKFKASYVS